MKRAHRTVLCSSLALFSACSGDDAPNQSGPPVRPITVITAEATQPSAEGAVVGVAEPYREEQIGFEVGGRVILVADLGTELRGPMLDDNDKVIEGKEGQQIARIDTVRYDQALRSAELTLASAKKGLAARKIEAGMAATSELEQAQAQQKIAEQDLAAAVSEEKTRAARLARTKEQFDQNIASQAQLETEQSAYDSAAASLESARQGLRSAESGLARARSQAKLKEAQVEQSQAEIEELAQQVVQAELDFADCALRAPFSGRITDVHVGRGGYVQAGTAVVTLTAMNPIQVSVTVSAERSRGLLQGAQVALMPRELENFTGDDVLYGVVFGKAEVADAATRTYRIDILARNLRRSRTPRQIDGKAVYGIDYFMPVLHEEYGGTGPLFVGVDCVSEEDGQTYVYKLPGMARFTDHTRSIDEVFMPERIPVELGTERLTFINFKFVRITDPAGLVEGDALIREPLPEHVEGVTLERYDWALRPGDLVPVHLGLARQPLGIYVPVEAVSNTNGKNTVFVVEGDTARQVEVTVHESSGGLRRIEGEGVEAGVRIVLEGAHYLADGDRVTVVDSVF